MPDKKLKLQIITPDGLKVGKDVDMVIMRCTTGNMGIMPGHQPLSAVLDMGILRMIDGDTELVIAVYGGLAAVQNDTLTIMAGEADWPEEIDRARAKADRDHAEQRLRERAGNIEIKNDEAQLRRALLQIEVSSYRIE